MQIVENLQRDDLSELEEAEGYATLVAATGIAKEDIGERIGRSRTYVYGRLKLLDLCPPARAALREGKIDSSRALLIARIPNDKLQIKALKEFCAKDFAGDSRMGHRAALVWIKQNVMLKLAEARFDTNDAALVPDAGICASCPKRTGADPDLFADVDAPDLCTDTECYQGKQAAHTAVITAKARARGMEVIEGKEALELKPQHYHREPNGLTRLDTLVYNPDQNVEDVPLREHLTKSEIRDQVKLFVDPHTGEAVEVVPDALAQAARQRLLRSARQPGPVVESDDDRQEREKQAQRVLTAQYEQRWRAPAVQAIQAGLVAGKVAGFEAPILRVILGMLCAHDDIEGDLITELLQLPDDGDFWGAIETAINVIPDTELGTRICTLLVRKEADRIERWSQQQRVIAPTPVIDCLAARCQVDLVAIKAEVQDAMRAEAAEKATPAPAAKKGRKGKKATEAGEA